MMPRPLPKRPPNNPRTCAHQWIEHKVNDLVTYRRCSRCRLEQGIPPGQSPAKSAAPAGPSSPPKAISDTLPTALEMAQAYQTALDGLLSGNIQSYTLPTGVTVTRNNLAMLESGLRYWRKEALRSANGMKTIANMGLVWPS